MDYKLCIFLHRNWSKVICIFRCTCGEREQWEGDVSSVGADYSLFHPGAGSRGLGSRKGGEKEAAPLSLMWSQSAGSSLQRTRVYITQCYWNLLQSLSNCSYQSLSIKGVLREEISRTFHATHSPDSSPSTIPHYLSRSFRTRGQDWLRIKSSRKSLKTVK